MKVSKTKNKEEDRKSSNKAAETVLKKARYKRGTQRDSSYNS